MGSGVPFRTGVTDLVDAIENRTEGNGDQVDRHSDELIDAIDRALLPRADHFSPATLAYGLTRSAAERQGIDERRVKKLREAVLDAKRYSREHPGIAVEHLRRALKDLEG